MSLDIISTSEDDEMGEYISTGSKVLDKVFPNGIPRGVPSMVFGAKDLGKTFLAYQIASHLYKDEGLRTLYMDTEKFSVQPDSRNRILDFFVDRWSLDRRAPIDFIFPSKVEDLVEYVGKGISIYTKGKKNTVRASIWDETDEMESPLAKQILSKEYGLVVIDSISMPLKEKISVPPQQNFSTRSTIGNAVLGPTGTIAQETDVGFLVTSHESKNPANKFDTGKFHGPDDIGYKIKYVMQLRGNPKKEERTAVRYRYPGLTSKRAKRTGEDCKLKEDFGFAP